MSAVWNGIWLTLYIIRYPYLCTSKLRNMKRILFLACMIAATSFAQAQPPKGAAKNGDHYGANIRTEDAKDIKELPALVKDDESKKPIKVKGKVLDVCSKKGCWAKVQIDDNTTAFVKMKDYAFFLPMAVKGKTVVIDGDAYVETTSVEELKHYAQDAKKTQEEIDAITEPSKQIRITASGIKVVAAQ